LKKIKQLFLLVFGCSAILVYLCYIYDTCYELLCFMSKTNLKLLFLLVLGCFTLNACSVGESRKVLVVHSYEETYAAYPDFNKMIAECFRKRGIDAEIRTLYLDCESYREKEEFLFLHSLLDGVSKNWKPEIILVNEDQATYSLLKCGHPLVKELPVVFGGVNYPNWELIKQYPNVTGFRDEIDVMANIGVIKEIFGAKTNLFTLIDTTYLDKQIRRDVREQVKGKHVRGFMDVEKLTAGQQRQLEKEEDITWFGGVSVRTREGNSDAGLIWSLSKYTRNRCYLQLKRDFTTVNIGNICSSPSFTAINEGFGYGEKLLGGYITTLPIQVEEMVDAAARILHGDNPLDIPIASSAKEYVMDWDVMVQRGLSKADIPGKYSIIHIPFSKKHPLIWGGIVLFVVILLVTLFVLLFFLYWREQGRKKKALNALEDEKETLALAIEGSDTYAWKLENDYFIFETDFWKSQGMKSKVLTFEELLNFIHPDHWNEVQENWKSISIIRKVAVQARCDFNGKGYQWWEFRYKTISLPGGGYKAAGLLLNVQAIKDHEQELEEARLLAEKAELKQSFLANMSHEIRTPLNAIVGFSNILAVDEGLEPEERCEYIKTINRNSDLLLSLINDILELSRLESGYMSFEFALCRMSELVDEIYQTHQMLVPEYLEFIKEPDAVQVEVNVDKGRLIQVIANFLNNASKFTTSGYIKLGYRYLSETSEVAVYVEDTGCGIPQAEQKMIFGRFYKQDEFSQGTGLGLSICQVIAEKLQGKIDLWSEPGKGSRFTVVLPVISD